ncbi:MAG TPA: hypothetical protein VHW60_09015, partial [Caulobacteraceae bacterium]|nr:hypothetical protein [Caulobacteraceae bacterium]
MFRSITARRRISLLTSSSLVASTVSGGALVFAALTPSAALAAPGCVTLVNVTTCNGAVAVPTTINITTSPQDVLFEGFSDTANTAVNTAVVTVNANNQIVNLDYNDSVAGSSASTITNTGAGDALDITDNSQNVTVTSDITTVGGPGGLFGGTNGTGLVVNNQSAGSGNINVTAVNTITGGGGGIHTLAAGGATTIDVTSTGAVSSTTGNAILASGGGHITVTGSGTVSGGTLGDGIQIQGKGGVTVDLTGNITGDPGINVKDTSAVGIHLTPGNVSGGAFGIQAVENGAGPIDIAPTGNVSASTGTGISAVGTGAGNITTTGHTVSGG